jgi:hypothetical protein
VPGTTQAGLLPPPRFLPGPAGCWVLESFRVAGVGPVQAMPVATSFRAQLGLGTASDSRRSLEAAGVWRCKVRSILATPLPLL